MQNFANQCLDMARSILEHNLGAIDENGIILPVEGELSLPEESAHALAAIGEFYRATRENKINDFDLIELGARCLKQQISCENNNSLRPAVHNICSRE